MRVVCARGAEVGEVEVAFYLIDARMQARNGRVVEPTPESIAVRSSVHR